MRMWLLLIVLVADICLAIDARNLGAKRGCLGGGFLDMSVAGWFAATLLLWWVTIPCYLINRPKLVRRAKMLRAYPMSTNVGAHGYLHHGSHLPNQGFPPQPQVFQPVLGPVPGWYQNPAGPGLRWWDGRTWTNNVTPA